jgi:protoporphyrinogen oxidase
MDELQQDVAVIGGGMMGISVALELARKSKHRVVLFEKESRLGGLSGSFQFHNIAWDKYYHVVLSTDREMLEFIRLISLDEELFWRKTKTGFYGEGRLVSFSSTMDFIRFPFMTYWQKIRMGAGILYSTMLKDPAKLDKIYVRAWLTKVFGRRVYERIWEPLLRSKLGDARERTSAAFIWATITRLYGARQSGSKVEQMGHVHGGYHRILQEAEKYLSNQGVVIHTGTAIKRMESDRKGSGFNITVGGESHHFDKVVFTVPCPDILEILHGVDGHQYWKTLGKVNYLGVTCVVLILRRSLSPYYVINLLDRELPFTGIIEVTNVVDPTELGGYHLVYLPKYATAEDHEKQMDDADVTKLFIGKLRKVFPDLKDEEIVHSLVFRDKWVQPLQELNSLKQKSTFGTPIGGVYVVNTSMILNSTLNNNAVMSLARKAVKEIEN